MFETSSITIHFSFLNLISHFPKVELEVLDLKIQISNFNRCPLRDIKRKIESLILNF
jgi:hypothetical protein